MGWKGLGLGAGWYLGFVAVIGVREDDCLNFGGGNGKEKGIENII